MAFVIFGDIFTFPEGNAATNRVYTYAKGFIENGINVHVICFQNEYLPISDGVIDGIRFYHPFNQMERNKYFIIRRWQKLIKYFRAITLIQRINKNDKIIAINCMTDYFFTTQLLAFILSKYLKTVLIIERSEHPLRNYQGSFLRKMKGDINSYLESLFCNGIFCISQFLIDFYKIRGVNPKKLFLVPSTVDTGRFQISCDSPLAYQYILYCGSLTIIKDGVHILIESFVKLMEKYPEVNLVLIGKGDTLEEEVIIKDLVATLKITNRVFFMGQLPRTDIIAYLINAKILALARPQSIIADAGFPSKLTEYLATGKPVVVTTVGEIPLYLKDNENAFLSKPDSVDAFSAKLDFVLSNYEFAKQVGIKGKELAMTVFNYNFQAKRMIDYISSLYQRER